MNVLCYLGPSLDLETARSIFPDAIFLPPARHADLISHAYQYEPTHILIIDGDFSEHLPIWHKECVFCALKGIKIYGSSSMGALRAAELADVGVMIGVGKIFHWYWEGICDADDEVCLLYHRTPDGAYVSDTCPLVNIRSGLLKQVESGCLSQLQAGVELRKQQSIHYTERLCPGYEIDQKRADAIELLSSFENLDYATSVRPDISWVTDILKAVVERERRVQRKSAVLTLQHIDSYISLHCPEHHQIHWDSKNRSMMLILCDILNVDISPEDVERERYTFCARHRLDTWDLFMRWLDSNVMSQSEFTVLCIQNARINKLHLAYASGRNWSRQTDTILNYLRTHDRLGVWVDDCADTERIIVDRFNDESFRIQFDVPIEELISEHLEDTGLEISGTLDNFLQESGIGGIDELRVSLSRYSLARKHG